MEFPSESNTFQSTTEHIRDSNSLLCIYKKSHQTSFLHNFTVLNHYAWIYGTMLNLRKIEGHCVWPSGDWKIKPTFITIIITNIRVSLKLYYIRLFLLGMFITYTFSYVSTLKITWKFKIISLNNSSIIWLFFI